jgi:hypothetical protein
MIAPVAAAEVKSEARNNRLLPRNTVGKKVIFKIAEPRETKEKRSQQTERFKANPTEIEPVLSYSPDSVWSLGMEIRSNETPRQTGRKRVFPRSQRLSEFSISTGLIGHFPSHRPNTLD